VLFNPTELPVTTVSRAVINIGFKSIRSICLSIKVLESLLDENSSPLMMSMLARSLHAASQAKALCQNLCDTEQEEVFVATLLCHLAELLVLGFRDEEVKEYSKSLSVHSTEQEKDRAAEKYLGVSLTRLSKSLIKQWRMQGLILDVVNAKGLETDNKKIQAVRLGNELSRTALLGWNSTEFKIAVEKVAEFQGNSAGQITKSTKKIADDTAEMITSFGKKTLVDFMPTSKRPAKMLLSLGSSSECINPNYRLQEEILEQISALFRSTFNINEIIRLILKGLNDGVGLERLALAIYDKERCRFSTKYCLGPDSNHWLQDFNVCYERSPSSFLFKLFQYGQPVWVGGEQFKSISNSLGREFAFVTGLSDFLIAPLRSNTKMVGFVYADTGTETNALNSKAFEEFSVFIEKANMALSLLAKRQEKMAD
jgi:HD-like signal output (HDOD) protein